MADRPDPGVPLGGDDQHLSGADGAAGHGGHGGAGGTGRNSAAPARPGSRFGRAPLLIALGAGVASLLIAFAPTLWHLLVTPPAPSAPVRGAPWQVDVPAPGRSRVFSLDLPGTTLADARRRWGEDLSAAVIAARDGPPALEAYVERFDAGGIGGRLLLVFELPAPTLARWRDTLPAEAIESGRRHALNDAAWAELGGAALVGLSFIPAAQLDADILNARFGAPAERIAADGQTDGRLEHWLYPTLGLAVALDAKGRDVLQYVAPADFERRLVAPLRATAPSAPASAGG